MKWCLIPMGKIGLMWKLISVCNNICYQNLRKRWGKTCEKTLFFFHVKLPFFHNCLISVWGDTEEGVLRSLKVLQGAVAELFLFPWNGGEHAVKLCSWVLDLTWHPHSAPSNVGNSLPLWSFTYSKAGKAKISLSPRLELQLICKNLGGDKISYEI